MEKKASRVGVSNLPPNPDLLQTSLKTGFVLRFLPCGNWVHDSAPGLRKGWAQWGHARVGGRCSRRKSRDERCDAGKTAPRPLCCSGPDLEECGRLGGLVGLGSRFLAGTVVSTLAS